LRTAVDCAHAAPAALAIVLVLVLALALPAVASAAIAAGAGADGTVIVREQSVPAEYAAYARVRPIAVVPVRAVEPGNVTALRVQPGSPVTAGETLATLSGPEIRALLVSRQGAARSAQTRLTAAKRALAAERRQLAGQLSTRQSVAAAQSAVAAATAGLQTAQAQLRVARELIDLRAPSPGTVIAVDAGSGERVTAGQDVLTLQPSGSLWLEATYYGADAAAIRVGMPGRFAPAAGGAPVAVKVVSVLAALEPDGGERVGLVATGSTPGTRPAAAMPWLDGEWGSVMVVGPTRPMIAVPTDALIIDRARWWVLVRTPGGDRPQPVVPGPTRGWNTLVAKGLEPGQRVVVQNAYLEFHRGIAHHYTPPY
jgi:RND family efflux transporter MFP subunit